MKSRPGITLKTIVVLLVVAGVGTIVTRRVYPFNECGKPGASACPNPKHEAAAGTTIERSEFCTSGAGYLCTDQGLMGGEVRRWSLFKGVLYVRVPLPDDLTDAEAKATRSAAIAGILQWNGHPFRIAIDSGSIPMHRWDVAVLWTGSLASLGAAGGVTHYEPAYTANADEYSVRNIAVITKSTWTDGSTLSPTYVTTIAAHEMGHALGLGHSDRKSDVMYPSAVEGTPVSDRDLESVDMLYALPAGATIH